MTVLPRILYTVDEAVTVTGIGKRSIQKAIADGSLPSIFNKGARRIKADDLMRFAYSDEPRPVPRVAVMGRALPTHDAAELPAFAHHPARVTV